MNDATTLKVFDSGDRPFFEWMEQHPNGLVLNTIRSRNTGYGFIHRSRCGHISGYTSYMDNGGFTEREYIKICSENAAEIWDWILENRPNVPGRLQPCKDCIPDFPLQYSPPRLPEEVEEPERFIEGGTKTITVNARLFSLITISSCVF